MSDLERFRPYLPRDFIMIFERARQAAGLSLGRALLDSPKFNKGVRKCKHDKKTGL